MISHPEVELRFRPTLMLNIRATGAVRACLPRARRMRRWARWAIPVGVIAALAGHDIMAVWFIALPFIVEASFWAGVLTQGTVAWWGARHARGEQRIEIGAGGMRLSGPFMRSDIRWEAITAVHDRRRFIVLLLRHGRGCAIPKRGRMDQVENAVVLAWLREREGWPSLHGTDPGEVPLEQGNGEVLLTFRLSREVLAAASREVTWRSPVGVGSLVFLSAMWALVGLRPLETFVGSPSVATLPGLIMALVLAGMFGFIVLGGSWWHARRLVPRHTDTRPEQQVGVSPEGIRARGPVGVATVDWSAVRRAIETRRFFLMFTSHSRALYVPKEFCTEQQLADIRALLVEYSGLKQPSRRHKLTDVRGK